MDLMAIRRGLMTQPQQTYVKNGLVLWLDGIDKGSVTGSWVDKVFGYEFVGTNNPTFGTDYVETSLSDDTYLTNSTVNAVSTDDGTIEVVISGRINTTAAELIYMPSATGIAFGFRSADGAVIWAAGNKTQKRIPADASNKCYSINKDCAVVDGAGVVGTGDHNWAGMRQGTNYIGRRYSGDGYTGRIYAIRIYNRRLTESEMLHNQRIDNQRFNLGLSI